MPGPTAGIGYREAHAHAFAETDAAPLIPWVEAHAENYTMPGGRRLARLLHLRRRTEVSLHAVGLSLAGAEGIDGDNLNRLADLCRRVEPILVSDHLAWSRIDGTYFNDLLPLPYSEEALAVTARNVEIVQDRLGRAILVENPARILAFADSTLSETDFLVALARRTGCGLLVDVNNIHVSCRNLGGDAAAWLRAIPADLVGEIHLAGHSDLRLDDQIIAFDDHGSRVREETWRLYRGLTARIGRRPTLIEWDNQIPPLSDLLEEARRAESEMEAACHVAA